MPSIDVADAGRGRTLQSEAELPAGPLGITAGVWMDKRELQLTVRDIYSVLELMIDSTHDDL